MQTLTPKSSPRSAVDGPRAGGSQCPDEGTVTASSRGGFGECPEGKLALLLEEQASQSQSGGCRDVKAMVSGGSVSLSCTSTAPRTLEPLY